jgi:hypothetical protein
MRKRSDRNLSTTNSFAPPTPQNLDAENAILAAVMQGANPALLEHLDANHFFNPLNRRIFARIQYLVNHENPVNLRTVEEKLNLDGEERARLADLFSPLYKITNDADLESYIQLVKRNALHRSLLHGCEQMKQARNGDAPIFAANLETKSRAFLDALSNKEMSWLQKFHMVEDLPDGDVEFLISGILPAGVTFIGGLSGLGKTWFALSMARALALHKKFLGCWDVAEPIHVLYLVPEMNARAFKRRCVRLGIGGERFLCRTISDGAPLNLSDSALRCALRELKPVLFLDTAIRFSNSQDENSSAENQALARAIFALLHDGARAVVCLHHRAKESARVEELTLENCLRGTGDLGAICDAVFGLQLDRGDGSLVYAKESRRLVRLSVRCAKARDFCPPQDFRLQLDPFIDQIGDFGVLTDESEERASDGERLAAAIAEDPRREKTVLEKITGVGRNRQQGLVAEFGWSYDRKTGWSKRVNP